MAGSDRWEHGSEFHWLSAAPQAATVAASAALPWRERGLLYGSGRDALRALLDFGRAQRGWRRLWLPSFFCQEVVAALAERIEVAVYPDSPLEAAPAGEGLEFQAGDALLWVNYFGLRAAGPLLSSAAPVEVIEDHTHDPLAPLAQASTADWCVAALRKTLPIPDGGVLWSPRGHALPDAAPLTAPRRAASLEKLAAMALKTLYLDGHAVTKETFRALALTGESGIASGPISAMPPWTAELIATFPLARWREQRRHNHGTLSEALAGVPWLRVLQPERGGAFSCAFAGMVLCDTPERRDHVRRRLMAARVYPAILWPLEEPVVPGLPPAHVDLSRRLLSIHCDMRYDQADLERVAALIRCCGEEDAL